MGVDLAHEAVSIPAERWQRWHKIARAIGNDDCALAKELCIANTAPTRRNLYWAATAARIPVQWTTGVTYSREEVAAWRCGVGAVPRARFYRRVHPPVAASETQDL